MSIEVVLMHDKAFIRKKNEIIKIENFCLKGYIQGVDNETILSF